MSDLSANNSFLRLLKRSDEFSSSVDSIGNYESQHSSLRWDASLYRPSLDIALMQQSSWRNTITWPHGKRFAACLTHDVDTGRIDSRVELARVLRQNITAEDDFFKKAHHLLGLAGMRRSPAKTDIFSPWVEAEKKHGFLSTFYFFPSKVRQRHVRDNVYRWDDITWYRGGECKLSDVVRDLDDSGWEIGLHGSFMTANDGDMMLEQKEDIEQFLKTPMISIRQHNLHFDAKKTPDIMENAGFMVDSTLGFNRDIGFRAGTSYPFHLWNPVKNNWMKILEIPLILHDCALLRKDNLDLDIESAYALCTKIIDQVAAVKGVATLLWHPESYIKPYWFELYVRLLDYINSLDGWGTTSAQIYRWWASNGLDIKMHETLKNL